MKHGFAESTPHRLSWQPRAAVALDPPPPLTYAGKVTRFEGP